MKQSFFSELKRRQIYRGSVMYIVAGWVIVQVATTVFPYFSIPVWAIRLVMVVVLLGFPVALVSLWMFESHLPDPESRLVDRRRGADRDSLVKLMATERDERRKERDELLAALDQLKSGAPPGTVPTPGESVPHADDPAPVATPQQVPVRSDYVAPPFQASRPPPRRPSLLLLSILALAIVVSGVWALVAPGSIMQPGEATGMLARDYVLPGYLQVKHVAIDLLTPLVRKTGLPITPEHLFTTIVVVVGFLVLRDFWHQLTQALRRRRRRRAAG